MLSSGLGPEGIPSGNVQIVAMALWLQGVISFHQLILEHLVQNIF